MNKNAIQFAFLPTFLQLKVFNSLRTYLFLLIIFCVFEKLHKNKAIFIHFAGMWRKNRWIYGKLREKLGEEASRIELLLMFNNVLATNSLLFHSTSFLKHAPLRRASLSQKPIELRKASSSRKMFSLRETRACLSCISWKRKTGVFRWFSEKFTVMQWCQPLTSMMKTTGCQTLIFFEKENRCEKLVQWKN